ncbi:mitochondrial fusion and transport protein Ugo1p [Monosporozyma unispora]
MDHSNNRPYYNPETFNIGYPAIFRPGIGILDPHNVSLTDKLSIINKNSDSLTAVRSLGNIKNGMSLEGSRGNGSSVIQSVWQRFDTKSINIYSLLLRQLALQPFQVAKLLLQLISPDQVKPSKQLSTSILLDQDDNESEEIDFFPRNTQLPSSTSNSPSHSSTPSLPVTVPSTAITTTSALKFTKLDTWTIISTIQQKLGLKSLWTSFQNVLMYDTLYPIATFTLKRLLITPLLTVVQPTRWVFSLTAQTVINCIADFITEAFILLPISLNHIKRIMFMGQSSKLLVQQNLYSFHTLPLDHILVTVQGLTLLKVAVNNLYHHLFEFVIVYGINLSHLTPQERWIIIVSLNLLIESFQLVCKLPLESLINRFKWKYILEWTPSIQEDLLLFHPINVHSQEIWHGLWRGWRLHWVSRMCGTVFKYWNRLDTDMEWEKF